MRTPEFRVIEKINCWLLQEKVTDDNWHTLKCFYSQEDAEMYLKTLKEFHGIKS